MGASARRAGLSPTLGYAPISRRPVCFLLHTHPPFGPEELGGFFPSSCGRILSAVPEFEIQDLSPLAVTATSRLLREGICGLRALPLRDFFLVGHWAIDPRPRPNSFKFLGVAGGTIERSCYSPHYVNTERDYERDYQATLPQGRTAADGCKPRHGRDDRLSARSGGGRKALKWASAVYRIA